MLQKGLRMPKVANFQQLPEFAQLEEQVLSYWQEKDIFKQSVSSKPENKPYVFYDGPPFATGMPHYGHLLASTTKDVVPRYWTMKGYRVERVWGWDCHGLPIENMIEKKLDIKGGKKGIEELGIAKFNAACRAEVLRLDTEWERIIGRLGRWVDFEHSYKTMDKTFMESVWWGFKQLWDKNKVYMGKKVILYCPRCATPLSNFEIAMDNSYQTVTEPSTTYKYKVVGMDDTYFLAWSTTPWNKIVTPALAVNPNLQYSKVKQGDEFYIVADSAFSRLKPEPYEVVDTYLGRALQDFTFEPHYDFIKPQANERVGVIVADEFVTAEEGTGIVTLAVYGEDDFRVMQQHEVLLAEHVDEEGKIKPMVTPWAGKTILEVNPFVDEELSTRGLIYRTESHTHSVATCYRCNTRLYYAPVPAWFIDIANMRNQLLSENEKINWYPEHLKNGRFKKGLENAPDWNISRSRYWGTPMPIWINEDMTDLSQLSMIPTDQMDGKLRVIGSVEELKEWAVNPEEVKNLTDIHPEFINDIEVWVDAERTKKGKRIQEVFDCWIESGSMPYAAQHYPFENQQQFEARYPAQFVSEYIAQTRAWFYTMHVISVGIFDQPPFENVLTTGTIMAEDGTKMSKSKLNYPDPMLLIEKYGADSLRLYLMSSTVMKAENLNFSEKDVADIRRRVFVIWWNLLSFYKSFADTSGDATQSPAQVSHILDKWMLAELSRLVQEVTEYMDHYDVVRASRSLMEFVDVVSTWFLRLSRERIKSKNNQDVSQVFGYVLTTLTQVFAPFAPFFTEVAYQSLINSEESVHLTQWPESEVHALHSNQQLLDEMLVIRKIVELGHAQRKELQLKVRQPLSKVSVTIPTTLSYADELTELLQNELNVKAVDWQVEAEAALSVMLDTELTPELKAEGEAREIMRNIQNLRKKQQLKAGDHATVEYPSWPEAWKAEIEQKTNVTLMEGSEAKIVG